MSDEKQSDPMAGIAAEIVRGMSEIVRAEVERKCAAAIANSAGYAVENAVSRAVSAEIERTVLPQVKIMVANLAPQITAEIEKSLPIVAQTIATTLVAKVTKNASSYRMDQVVKELLS